MNVSAEEFIRRFLLHVLPRGFVRIRSFGFLANAHRAALLPRCRQVLATAPSASSVLPVHDRATWSCPACQGTMSVVEILSAEGLRCIPIDSS